MREFNVSRESHGKGCNLHRLSCWLLSCTTPPPPHLYIPDVLPAPEWLKDAVAKAQHRQVLNQLLACITNASARGGGSTINLKPCVEQPYSCTRLPRCSTVRCSIHSLPACQTGEEPVTQHSHNLRVGSHTPACSCLSVAPSGLTRISNQLLAA
jgi:hypothetical protein